ncbi:unnamed protein product [Diamesa tonsa]
MEVSGTDSARKRLYLISQSGKFKNRIKKRSSIRCDDMWSPQLISPSTENPLSDNQITPELPMHNELTTDQANTDRRSTNSETVVKDGPEDNKNTNSNTKNCALESSF